MLKKARQGKHGRHPTILSRWYGDEEYRKSLSAIGWKEHHIMLYDRIALEKHIYIATRAERIQDSKHWIVTANAEGGTQQSLNQRPDFAQAKRECKHTIARRAHGKNPTRIQSHSSQSTNKTAKKGNNLKATKTLTTSLTRKTGRRFFKQSRGNLQTTSLGSRANLQTASSSLSTWDQTLWKTSNWNS